MNKQQLKTHCDLEKLELFLRGTLSSSETEILELHLTECESCARQIQLKAEQGVSWHEVQSLLAADEYDSPQHIAALSSLLSDEHNPMTKHQTADVLSREIRGWLDATDDPRSMGRFAGYEIVGIVGHGGMGIVLKGFEVSLNRFVAIKILAPRLATNGSARKRFAREAQAAAAVRHDNVIAIHRVDEWHGLPFLVMPYAGGISLQKRIDSDGPLSIEQTLRVGVQIASGLAAAHAQGLIHRDIKPANILVEQGVERVTITDFGLARAADDASVTRTGVIAGTPQYMSPEQAEAKQLDARSDLFSLGSVLYAMATGRPPFRGAGSFEVLKRIVNEPARPMREIEASVPEWFENIVNRLHSKSPNDRPSSAGEVAALLEECLAHVQQPTTALLPESLAAIATSDNRNRRRLIGRFIASAAFAFSLVFAGVLIVLELNKGTLTIECEADDVPIRIMQGKETVKRLTVNRSGKAVRIAAGNYIVVVDGESDVMTVAGGQVSLRRGDRLIAKIVYSDVRSDDSRGVLDRVSGSESDSDFARTRFGGKITVDIYGGRDVMPQMNTEGPNKKKHVQLLQDLNAIEDVVINFRESGVGHEIFNIIVRDPSMIREREIQLSGKPVRLKTAINLALRNAGIENVHWEEGSRSQEIKTESEASSRPSKDDAKTPDYIALKLYGSQAKANRECVARCAIRMPEGSTVQHVFSSDADNSQLEMPRDVLIPFNAFFAVRYGSPVTFRVTKIPRHQGQSVFVEFEVADLNPTIAAELKSHQDFQIEVTHDDVTNIANGKRVTKVLLWSSIRGPGIDVSVSPDNEPPLDASPDIEGGETQIAVLRLSDRLPSEMTARPEEARIAENESRAWQQTEPYVAPDFLKFFPDSRDGGLKLDALWNAADKDSRSDEEIQKAVREGFRNTGEHRMPILRWIGNKYIWNKSPQNPDAIEIMYHAADFSGEDANPSGARHAAVYFGLSVTQPKTPAILRTLAELSMHVDDPNDLDRIAWGCSNQKAELLEYLKPFEACDDEAARSKADVCRRIFNGELKAFAWAAEQARQRAEKMYSSQLPQFKETLMSGSSEERLKALQTILAQRIALIMDDSFVAAFAICAEDKDPQVRVQTTIIAGARWVWEAQEQNPEAIQLMLRLSTDDHRDVRYNAVYYGLSTIRNKSDDVIRRLLEMAFEDREWNLFHRIEWGLRDDRERAAILLTEYINGDNATHAKAAREVFKQLTGREEPQPQAAHPSSATPEDFIKPGEDRTQGSDRPSLSKTLQQLQGKWRLTRQIAADGDESITPASSTWEFKGQRIIVRDGGPGGVMLIKLDESHSPAQVEVTLEGEEESGLGLLSIEGDKLILCLGEHQKAPELRSSPEKLEWVTGVWYMQLQRMKPGETIEPVKPNTPNATANGHEAAIVAGNTASRKTSEPSPSDAAHTISGFVMEFRSGTPDVPVCLCDAATGMPVAKDTYKPIDWSQRAAGIPADEMAIVVSDAKGNFRFENVPDGKYRLIAQKWMGPYKGVFELHGAEIRLLGAIDEITVPRPADEQEARVVPTPLGENTIQFNQDVGNNETFLFLSTAPPEFDPILGLQGLGTSFWKNLIGVNRMPLGKTTVIGSPNKPVYAFMIAPDNSPGYAAITIPPPESGLVRLPAEPFVAGWSDGRKTPPAKLAELIEFTKKHELSVQQLLNIPEMSNANFKAYQARMQELTSDLSRVIELPEGESARIGDLLAADAYRKLEK